MHACVAIMQPSKLAYHVVAKATTRQKGCLSTDRVTGAWQGMPCALAGSQSVMRARAAKLMPAPPCVQAGMDMGIVNAQQVEADKYEKLDKELLEFVEDVLLNR